ncbi:MAG: hypothetical protein IJM59_08410, partial [Proteobacteria bacterium]|nr:hypothetical protein [Pseudomonadota bacterium]
MPLIPDAVRFHFARQAPSPWNWYTKPDFAGCALSWSAPEGNVALYIVFRCSENLPSDCCEDLLAGHYDDIVERIDIFKPITRLVDDEIHDKNRYLVLAKLDNEDLVWIQDVESTQFTGAAPGETWTYWSNPYGDSPKIKDPCRLDYSTIRVGTFCGFEWDYPSQYPDFVGFDLIVCDVPYSPHTGAESDIEAYRAVLSGKRGMTYSLDRFVNTVIDNESFANRFWYYALLVRLPDSGRVQIPLRHISEPFEKGKPFQYLKARPSWGEGRDRMMAAYARWKAQDNAPKQAPAIETAATHQEEPAESCDLEFFQHAPTLELDNFIAKPNMIGIQFRAMLTEGTKVFAIRATHPLDPTYCAEILRKAQDAPNVREPDCDVFAFCPNNGYMLLIDDNCHDRSWYAFATYDEDSDQFVELTHVKDTTIDFLTNANEAVSWGNTHLKFENHVLHCFKLEEISKKNVLSLEFGIIDESAVTSIELYRFDEPPVQDMDHLDDFHLFQQTGAPKLGERFVIDHVCPGIIDDVSNCDAVHYYAAVSVDKNQNRFPLSVFSQGNQERESWERLSDICRQSPSLPQDLPNSMEIKSLSESDIISAAISDISEISGPREQVPTNHPASTGDDIETAGTNILNVDNLGVHKRISKRKFSWDDESDLDDVSSQTDDDSETNISNRDNLNIHNRISKRTYSSEKESVRTDASDDISEDETHTHIANISKDINRKVSAKSRYSWDDDISAGSSDSSNSENAGTNVFSIDQFGIHKRIPTPLPDDTELADDNEFEETNIASIHDHNVHKRISKRKYSWDDDISDSESNTAMTGDEEDYETNIVRVNHLGSRKPASSSVESDSSRSVNESKDVFVVEKKYETVDDDMNSDDEDSSGITKIYSRRTFSWDDDEPERNDNRQELRKERDNSDQSENPGVPQDDHSSDDSIHFEEKHISPKNRADTHTHNQRPNVSGTRKRFSWDDEALNDSETEHRSEEFHRSQENSSVDHNEESRPGISGARRRFSWDDETPNNEPKSENSRSSREFAAIEHHEETRSSASDINSISGARRRFQWDDEPIESSHKSEDNSGNLDNNVSTSGARRRFSWDGNEQSSNEEKSGNHSVSRDNNQSSGVRRRFSWDDETPNDNEPKSENSRSSREYSAIEQHEETRSSTNGISSLGGARRRFSWDDETPNDGGKKSENSRSSREYSAIEQHEETRSSTNGISSLGGARRRFSWDDETPNDGGKKSE